MKSPTSKSQKSLAKKLDLFISSKARIVSNLIEKVLDLKSAREKSVSLDIIRYFGPKESEMAIRDYLENYSFPRFGIKMLRRYPVTVVFCELPIRGHSLNDVAFFDNSIKTKKDVERLLARAVYRSFLQKAEKLGVHASYGNINRLQEIFYRRFHTKVE